MYKHIRYDKAFYVTHNRDGSVNLFLAHDGTFFTIIDRWAFENQYKKVG